MLFCSSAGNQESLGLDEGEFRGASSRSSMGNIKKSYQTKTLCLNIAEVSACTSLLLSPCLQLGARSSGEGSSSSLAVLRDSLLVCREEEQEPGDRLTCLTYYSDGKGENVFPLLSSD